MGKIAEATARLFKNVFICKNCHSKLRADPQRILNKEVSCRKCKKRKFRAVKKK